MSVLADIVAARKEWVKAHFADGAVRAGLERAAVCAPRARSLRAALIERSDVAVIAEVKRRSPSHGDLAPAIDAAAQAGAYVRGGAAAVSVLTEPDRFGGSLDDLAAASQAVAVPVLCKDFVVDPVQLLAARAAGADAVLLMVSVLGAEVPRYLDLASSFGLEAIVEVHDEHELRQAAEAGARIVGVNARDLRTLAVDLPRALELVRQAREVAEAVVAESGISGRADVEAASYAGADAVLVGTALVRAASPEEVVRDLTGVGKEKGHA